jgi:hypothetical protein
VPTVDLDHVSSDEIAGKKAVRLYLPIGPRFPMMKSAISTHHP